MNRLFFLGVFFVISVLSYSHLWLEEDGKELKLLYGHKHSSHEGASIMEYKPEYVLDIRCLKNGKIEKISFERKYPVSVYNDCDVYYVLFSSGYWTKTVYGAKNISKEGQSQVLKSWQSFESVKYIKKYSERLKSPLSEDLEIVLLTDTEKVKSGDKLRLQVFYKGKPAKDVVIAYKDKPRGTTDEEGKINITVKEKGFQIISATLTEKGDGIKCDEIIRTANLNFIVKE